MASTFTVNNGLEKPGAGEQEGAWGGTLNTNFDIIDRVLSGVGSVALSGTTHTLTTSDGSLSDGQFKVINFTGALGANNTITISPNDQDKLYFIINATTDSGSSGPYSIIISQGSGANVTIPNGGFDIVIADGAGSGAAVTSVLSKKITTGQLTTTGNVLIPDAGTIGSASDPDAISISSGGVVDFTQVPTFPNDTIETNDIQDNAVTLAKMAGLARGKIIVGDSSGDPSALALGSNGQVLQSDGSDLVFGSGSASVALDDIGTGDAASTLATSAGDITIDAQGSNTDIILKGTDGTSDITGIKIDKSETAQVQFPNDSQALAFGADQDVLLTHLADSGLILTSDGNSTAFRIDENVAGASSGPSLNLVRFSDSPADNDFGGAVNFFMENDNNETFTAAQIKTKATDVSDGTEDCEMQFHTNTDGTGTTGLTVTGAGIQTASIGASDDTDTSIDFEGSNVITFNTGAVEVGRITSSRYFLIGTTTLNGNGFTFDTVGDTLTHTRPSGSAQTMVMYRNGSSIVGEIRSSTTSTAYITSSDYRLKENVASITDGIVRLKQLKPSRFNFIADKNTTLDGFLAHEAQSVVPEAISGTKDEMEDDGKTIKAQGIDQAKLVPLLTAALQEAVTEIESLKTRVAALEGS